MPAPGTATQYEHTLRQYRASRRLTPDAAEKRLLAPVLAPTPGSTTRSFQYRALHLLQYREARCV
eukprot:1202605-Rhodomonas_salina.1